MKKFFPILFAVIVIAAFAVVPAFARGENPPVDPAVFDWVAISNALQSLLIAFFVPAAGFLARWLYAKGNYAKSQLTTDQVYLISTTFRIFVYAAEQMHAQQFITDKLDYVMTRAEAWLINNNIFMDLPEIRARIEAIVKQEFGHYSPPTPTE